MYGIQITTLWQSIPSQLMHDNKKFFFSRLKKGARFKEYEEALQWLVDSGLVHRCLETETARLPLAHYADLGSFRLFALDVGLVSCMARVSPHNVLGKQTLFNEFKGVLTENFAAQELAAKGYPLYYWASRGIAEVDFVIEIADRTIPVEVKSGENVRSRSQAVFKEKYSPGLMIRFSALNLKKDGPLLNIPLYSAGWLEHFI